MNRIHRRPATEAGYRGAIKSLATENFQIEGEIRQVRRQLASRSGQTPEPLLPRALKVETPRSFDGLRARWDAERFRRDRLERELAGLKSQLTAPPKPDPRNPFADRSRSQEQREIRNADPERAARLADEARIAGFGDQVRATGV